LRQKRIAKNIKLKALKKSFFQKKIFLVLIFLEDIIKRH